MDFEWDEGKRLGNLGKHGVDFAAVVEFEWNTIVELQDVRQHYGEIRQAPGIIDGRLYMLINTRRDRRTKVIGLRKAGRKEKAHYAEKQAAASFR